MNITGIQQTANALTAGQPKQSNQDSHEISIQKQILTLQEKMRGITNDKKMSAEEKEDEKKALQEKIQNLNSELKQYQLQKRQEEAEKRQEEAARQKEAQERTPTESSADAGTDSATGKTSENVNESNNSNINNNTEEQQSGQANADVMFSMSGAKEYLADMQQVRAKLEGQMRTASTAEEKAKLQKKIDEISKKMGEKVQKVSDTIEDTQKEKESRKEKVKRLLQEFRDKRKNMNAAVPKTTDSAPTGSGYWKDGKVLLTRKK